MATRSPLRAVSNVSNLSEYEATDTVQIKPKNNHEGAGTPEWRKRLIRGEIPGGEQRDLFAPMGLESVFKPPTPGSVTQESIAFAKQDDQLWDFTDATSRQDSAMQRDESAPNDHDSQRVDGADDSGTGMFSPLGTVNRAPWADKRPRVVDPYSEGVSQGGQSDVRTASGLEDLRNEGITPITFTRANTLEGNGTSEVIKSALKQVTNKLEGLSVENSKYSSRPDSPASDSFLFYNHSDPRPGSSPHEDSLLDVTSHSLPQDLSMGTLDFSRRKVSRPFHQQFSPSPFPSYRIPPKSLNNAKTRSSPLFSRSQANGSPSLPRPSSSHVRPSTSGDAVPRTGAMPSGSPLKLFGEHDTFTNNRLLRRMSQFEETFDDGSDGDEPPSPSEEARRKGESRSFLHARNEPLSEITPRRAERPASRNVQRPRISRFGDGELDKYDFSDTSPYEHKLAYEDMQGAGSRPSSRKRSSGRHFFRRGSRDESLKQTRSASSSFTRKPSLWMRQSYHKNAGDATWSSSEGHNKENIPFAEVKRVPKKSADPNPKRRRTIVREANEAIQAHQGAEFALKHGDSMSLLQRSLLQHGVQLENGDYLAPPGLSQSMQRPRTPTPSQIRSAQESKIAPPRKYSESNFENLDYSDSFSLEGDIPLVKITGTSDSSRKGSITTQDYLNEATKIMDLIRSKGRPAAAGLSSVQESEADNDDAENEDLDLTYEDESSREAFSRPPSRDGTDLRKIREPKQLNPQILNYLKQYQEREEGEFNESAMSFNQHPRYRDGMAGEDLQPNRLAPGTRKRKTSGPMDDIAETIAQDLMTINTQMSGFSINSVPSGSSQTSQAKGMLSSDMVAHLIPEQVNGFTYDRSKHSWVKQNGRPLAPRATGDDNDPFQDIPDLSVDELQEMMRVNSAESPLKTAANQHGNLCAEGRAAGDTSEGKPDANIQSGDRVPSANESSVHSKGSRTSTGPSGTRETSWSTDEVLPKGRPRDASGKTGKKDRVATISFSSPLVSHVAYRDDPEGSEDAHSTERPADAASQSNNGTSSSRNSSRSGREASRDGQSFTRRPVSRIDERNEEGGDEYDLVRRRSMDMQENHGAEAGQSLIPIQTDEHDTSYSFHMSPLAEFSVNHPDHLDDSVNLEMSYVAQRTNPKSIRQIHGQFALADEDLVKHITDVEPYEPYWEHVRRLVLRKKGLMNLHKLSEYCPRLEDLDVTENEIGQLTGVPMSLRTLKIPRNHLSELTAWGHMVNLQYLDISGNDIETLDGFSNLIHLRELKANDNHIQRIDGILDLNGLLSLKLSNNSLTSVDFESCEL